MKIKNKLTTIIIPIILFILIIVISVLLIHQMEESIRDDCSKQNNEGIIKYWDADVNCSQIENLENRTIS